MSKAIVLGARPRSGNIGEAVAFAMREHGWDVHTDDCYHKDAWNGEGYRIPSLLDHGDADALVVTLGRTSVEPFEETDSVTIKEVIRANLLLPLEAALEYVQIRGEQGGRIVFIGSYAHRHPFTAGTAYSASKAGLEMAARNLGWELTSGGFYTTIVHPYHVEGTPMWEKVQNGVMEARGWTREEADQYAYKDALMGRLLSPAEVAEVVAWLLTADAAVWLSGTNVELFGGTR